MKILDLPLKKEWYIMIEAGEKPEEYRGITQYWMKRLMWCHIISCINYSCHNCLMMDGRSFKDFSHVRFRYGYTKRTMLYEIKSITVGFGNHEWGAPKDREVFIIKIGKRIKQND